VHPYVVAAIFIWHSEKTQFLNNPEKKTASQSGAK
jgi:hypothetical protein